MRRQLLSTFIWNHRLIVSRITKCPAGSNPGALALRYEQWSRPKNSLTGPPRRVGVDPLSGDLRSGSLNGVSVISLSHGRACTHIHITSWRFMMYSSGVVVQLYILRGLLSYFYPSTVWSIILLHFQPQCWLLFTLLSLLLFFFFFFVFFLNYWQLAHTHLWVHYRHPPIWRVLFIVL